eukprot:PhM_4_TR1431/c0_g2_i1/m.12507/K06700/PSMF1; proteasome inhibitor subunit 1 (PI31)
MQEDFSKVFDVVTSTSTPPNVYCPTDLLNIAVYAAMLARGFVNADGAAAPRWCSTSWESCYVHTYRHPLSTHTFTLRVVPIAGRVCVIAADEEGDGELYQAVLSVADVTNSESDPTTAAWVRADPIYKAVSDKITSKLVPLDDDQQQRVQREQQYREMPPPRGGGGVGAVFPSPGAVGGYGRNDLLPAGGVGIFGGPHGGGMLMGEEYFRGGGAMNPRLPGGVAPPRFDPYGAPGASGIDPDNDMFPTFPSGPGSFLGPQQQQQHGARFPGRQPPKPPGGGGFI